MTPEWLFALAALILLSLLVGICVDECRRERRRMRETLGRVVSTPQMVKHPERPSDIPDFCPICDRRMSWPLGVAKVTTPIGWSQVLIVCSHCLALGALDSATAAATEKSVSPSCTELAQPCGSYPDRAISDLPGGGSPAAGTF